jgi:hypothetical protein
MEAPSKPERPRPPRRIDVTPAKRAANQRNGKLSRGSLNPKSRRRSAMNALKDGFFAETAVLPDESEADYNTHMQIWLSKIDVEDGPEAFFLAAGADSAWKYKRCMRALRAVKLRQIEAARRAETPDTEQELREAALIADNIHANPLEICIRLRETPAGCEWLKNQWMILYNDTMDDDCLFNSQRIRGCWLLGKRPRELFDDPAVRQFTRIFLGSLLSIRPELKSEIINVFLQDVPTEEHGYYGSEFEYRFNHLLRCKLPRTSAEAAALQREFISKEMAELEARAARLRRDRARDAALGLAGTPLESSVESARRERQIAAYYRRAEAGLAQARKLRTARLAGEFSAEAAEAAGNPEPSPVVNGQPPAEATPPAPPAAPQGSATEPSPGTAEGSPLAPPATPDEARSDTSEPAAPSAPQAPERRNGLGGAVLPALVLLFLAPLLGGPARPTAPEPQRAGTIGPAAATRAVGRPVEAAVQSQPERTVDRDSIDRAGANRSRQGSRWATSRGAALEVACGFIVPPEHAWQNDPKLGATRAFVGESSSRPEAPLKIGLWAKNSPGPRGPPVERR